MINSTNKNQMDTIEDVLKKMFDENSNWYTDEPDKPYVQAMTFDEFKKVAASLNRQGCRWAKASERLPEVGEYIDNHYSLKASLRSHNVLSLKFNGVPYCGTYYESLEGGNIKCFAIANHDYTYQEKDFDKIEWLDESIEPCATSSEKQITVDWVEEIYDSFANWYHDDGEYDNFHRSEAMEAIKLYAQSQTPSPTGDRDCEELKKENDELRKEIEALKSNLYSKED